MSAAAVQIDDGHMVFVGRRSDSQVWLTIGLPAQADYTFSASRAPLLRIDVHPAEDLDSVRSLSQQGLMRLYVWTPRAVSTVLWHGIESQGPGKLLEQLRAGSRLQVRYLTSSQEAREIAVPLEGAAEAIDQVLGTDKSPALAR